MLHRLECTTVLERTSSIGTPAPRLFEAEERLFGWAEVVFWRDAAGWCPFCEITWLVLEAMAVPYRMRTVPLRCYMLDGEQKDLEYTAAVGPEGVVPAVQFRTSAAGYGPPVQSVERIFDELRRRYPSRFPAGDAAVRARACEGEGSVFGRLRVARRSYEACAGARGSELSVLEPLASALTDLDALLEEAEAAAATRGGDGPEGARPQGLWLDGGSSAGVADLMLLPLLERTAAVVPYFFGDGALAGLRFGRAEAYLRRATPSMPLCARTRQPSPALTCGTPWRGRHRAMACPRWRWMLPPRLSSTARPRARATCGRRRRRRTRGARRRRGWPLAPRVWRRLLGGARCYLRTQRH